MSVSMILYPLEQRALDRQYCGPMLIPTNALCIGSDYDLINKVQALRPRELPDWVETVYHEEENEACAPSEFEWLTAGEMVGIESDCDNWPFSRAALAYIRALPPDTPVLISLW